MITQKSRHFAQEKHKGQRYGVHDYYDFHVQGVVDSIKEEVTSRMGVDYQTIKLLLTVAYLHDVVEDTDTTVEEIAKEFGEEVAEAVDAMTHRDCESYQQYVKRASANPLAKTVKFHDILFNLTQTLEEPIITVKGTRRRKKYMAALKTLGGM